MRVQREGIKYDVMSVELCKNDNPDYYDNCDHKYFSL